MYSAEDPFDEAHMIIGSDLSGGTAGVAFVGTMCGSYNTGKIYGERERERQRQIQI